MATHGGKRPGAGRPRQKYRTSEMARKYLDSVENDKFNHLTTPLDFMLKLLNNPDLPLAVRFDAAKHAAPFVHPKLQSVNVQHEDDNRLVIELVDFTKRPVTNSGVVQQSLTPSLPQLLIDIDDE